jgi:hypothetical protein
MTNHSIDNIVKEFINEIIPEYKKNHGLTLNFGFLFTFAVILMMAFGYLSYSFFFNISFILLTIFGIMAFYFYNKFGGTKQKFYSLYSDFEWEINSILQTHGNDISKSMIIWFFIIESPIENNIFSSLLLNSMKHDINHTDYYGNTILHHFLSHDINESITKVYISHAILTGANLDIKNDKSISPRLLLTDKYPEYLAIIEQLEISKSFKR